MPSCPWLLVEPQFNLSVPSSVNLTEWTLKSVIQHSANVDESVLLFKRISLPVQESVPMETAAPDAAENK
jgi:hypothetical protein